MGEAIKLHLSRIIVACLGTLAIVAAASLAAAPVPVMLLDGESGGAVSRLAARDAGAEEDPRRDRRSSTSTVVHRARGHAES